MPGDAGGLIAPIFTTDELLAATGDQAWLRALLDVEAALARAEAAVGVIPHDAAEAIAERCTVDGFSISELGRAARLGGNPVIPLVHALTAAVPDDARPWVHFGATSQDILDTAVALIATRATAAIDTDLAALTEGCAGLTDRHRDTLMSARTLLQPALPIPFGLKTAGWLMGAHDARGQLQAAATGLTVQLGGAVGSLASFGDRGPAVITAFAAQLHLVAPLVPWHTSRQRVAALAGALGTVAGTAAKIATDVALLMQAEVAEAFEPMAEGRGESSAMPHKRNPVLATEALAAARRAIALVPVVLEGLVADHERPLSAWHAEWSSMSDLLQLAGGAVARAREIVTGLEVDADRMAGHVEAHPTLLAERVTGALIGPLHRDVAQAAVRTAVQRTVTEGLTFTDVLLADPAIAAILTKDDLASLLDPRGYLGSSAVFIDRALAVHRGQKTSE